jgi:hypothetical protein
MKTPPEISGGVLFVGVVWLLVDLFPLMPAA